MTISTEKETTPQIVYTDEQQKAIDKIVGFIKNDKGREIRLVGSAGTGKTFILREIISQVEELKLPITIIAPTHKACKVAKESINEGKELFDNVYTPITLAKALGKIPEIKIEDGKQVFVDGWGTTPLSGIIIVDEASMVCQADLNKMQDIVGDNGIILYVLDPIQLPPIDNEGDVPPVYQLSIEEATLTQTQRFYSDSNIGFIASTIRDKDTQLSNINWKGFAHYFADKHDVNVYTDEDLFLDSFINSMTEHNWSENPDSVRCLSYTNKQVDKYNKHVKLEYFENDTTSPVAGEVFIAKKPFSRITPDSTPLEIFKGNKRYMVRFINNGEEFTLVEMIGTGTFVHPKYKDLPIHYEKWSCLKEDGTQFISNLVCNKSKKNYNKIDKDLTQIALDTKADKAKRTAWAKKYKFIECFDNCKRAYALTVHSSQGSTFKHIYFDMSSMLYSHNSRRIRRALCYTAMTRPTTSMSLYIPAMHLM